MSLQNLVQLFRNLSVASVSSVKRPQFLWHRLRNFSLSATRSKRDDISGLVPKVSLPQQRILEGTQGSEHWVAVDTSNIDAHFPTPEFHGQSFGGVPYTELPIVYIKATRNNTLINVVNNEQKVIIYTSSRLEGFKNARKKTQIAGHATGVAAGQKLMRRGFKIVRVKVKGLGPGRMTSVKGMVVSGVQVVTITDTTRLNELGPRPKKQRRLG